MADHARSALSCYDVTTLLGDGDDWAIPPCAPNAEKPRSWTVGHITAPFLSGMGFLDNLSMPVEPHREPEESQGETSTLAYGFFSPDHSPSALSCYGATLLSDTDDWAFPPSAPYGEISGSWTGSYAAATCISGMEFLAALPAPGFGQDASIYRCGDPSAPHLPAASTPLCSGAEWASAMQSPLHE